MLIKKHVSTWGRVVLFVVLLVCLIAGLKRILLPKYFYNQTWSTTSTYVNFYDMEENTVDVLFLGSSRTAATFSPQELYNQYGITSYNLGCEQQNLLVSYYWLKEALRFQSPKAVILDVKEVFPFETEEVLNSGESYTRKAMDYMKWSEVKREAVDDICTLDKNQEKIGYYFPLYRFHTRWKNLNEDDFNYMEMSSRGELKGFTALTGSKEDTDYEPFEIGSSNECAKSVPLMVEYLDRMTQLCKENGIELILVNTPYGNGTVERYNTMMQYAQENQLLYLDFNEEGLYNEISYNYEIDNEDEAHCNIWGAKKMLDYVGKILLNEYGIRAREDAQWENTREYYESIVKDCELTRVTDINRYLEMIDDSRYSVFIAIKDEGTNALTEEIFARLYQLGLTAPLEGQKRCSYYAVLDKGNNQEEIGYEKLKNTGSIRNGAAYYKIVSAGKEAGNTCSIMLNNKEYAVGKRGMNIVVYNNETQKVIDSVCFDTYEEKIAAER